MNPKVNQSRFPGSALKLTLMFLALNIYPIFSFAQADGDFRTFQTGAWDDVNTWERFDGVVTFSWVNPAPAFPTSADGAIAILSGMSVNIPTGISVTIDQTTIASNANSFIHVDNGGTLFLANGAGTDLTLGNTFTARGRLEIAGTFRIQQGAVIANATNTRLIVESTGIYQHNYTTTAGTIYSAAWNAGSTLVIMGYTSNSNVPLNLNQTYSNVTWNCTNQAADILMEGELKNINGNFTLSSTGILGNGIVLTETANNTLTVGGNMIVASTALVFFNGFSAAPDLTVNIAGNLTTSSAGSGLTGFDGDVILNISGNFVNNNDFILTTGGIGTATINLTGNFTHNSGTIDASGGAGALIFNGNSLQTYSAAGDFSGTIHFTINTNAIVAMGTSPITGSGNFTLNNSGELRVGHASGIVTGTSSGNIRVSGSRTFGSTSTIVYNGSSAQSTGNGMPSTVYNLTINNASNVSLTNNTTVGNLLSIPAGKLILGNINLVIAGTGSISGANSSRYIVTDLNGTLTMNNVGASSVVFPIGLSASYNPVTLVNTGVIDNISARVYSVLLGGANIADIVNRTWDLTEAVTGGSNFTITLQWNSLEEGVNFDRNNCGIGHFVAGAWDPDVLASAVGADPFTDSRSGLTSFGQFGVGDDISPLPIVLMSFTAELSGENKVDLSWATASETNNEYFDVEFSLDGSSWVSHGTVPGGGTTTTISNYSQTDQLEKEAIGNAAEVFYRLKQVDFDGQFEYSPAVPVRLTAGGTNTTSCFPNPFNEQLTIVYQKNKKDNMQLNLMGLYGNEVQSKEISDQSSSGTTVMSTAELPFGFYILRITTGNSVEYRKIIKQ